jgi:hypothetical protein
MKKSILLVTIFLISIYAYAQESKDVVYLKNGSVIKGEITEMIPNEHIKIKTADGSLFVYSFAEIEKTEKETVEDSPFKQVNTDAKGGYYSDYFIKSSLGVAIGGGGLVGLTYRYFPNEQIGVEGGIFYRPGFYEDYYGDIQTSSSVMFAFGPVFYLKTTMNEKGRIKKNGISVKVGVSPVGELNEFMGALNWVYDTYKPEKKNRYFSLELGGGFLNRYQMPYDISVDVATTAPLLYWKLNWFFSMK